MSIYDDPDGLSDWMDTRNKESGRRKTVYKKGETIRTYKNRTLHIHHPQTEKEWKKASKLRRSKAAKGRTRQGYEYADPFGLTDRQRRQTEYWRQQERKKESASMGMEDMRALLKDDHWEEVCGHTRWKYDRNSTIKEFRKYQMAHRHMY